MVDIAGVEGLQPEQNQGSDKASKPGFADDLVAEKETSATDGAMKSAMKTRTIDGLRVKFEGMKLAEGPKFKVNMVDLNQFSPEMEEIEKRLKMENEKMKAGDQKVSLVDYLFHCHSKNPKGLVCPRCSIMNDQGAAATYQRVYQEKARNNWKREKELLPYPQMGESLMGFLVRCHKMGSEVLMCPWCSALYDGRTAEAYKRIPYSQCWNNQS